MGCIKSLLGYRTVITSQMYGDKNQGSMEGSKELCIGGYASVRITTGRPAIDQYGTSELAKQQQPPTGRKGKEYGMEGFMCHASCVLRFNQHLVACRQYLVCA
jgi:hypothetical protein